MRTYNLLTGTNTIQQFKNTILPEDTRIIFLKGVRPEVRNPYTYLRIFLPQKTADLTFFFQNFSKSRHISKDFLPQKNGWFYHFFSQFLWNRTFF